MVLQVDEASVHFRSLADKLYALQKIKAEIADKAKNQFQVFLKDSILQHEEEFNSFDFREDCLEVSKELILQVKFVTVKYGMYIN